MNYETTDYYNITAHWRDPLPTSICCTLATTVAVRRLSPLDTTRKIILIIKSFQSIAYKKLLQIGDYQLETGEYYEHLAKFYTGY